MFAVFVGDKRLSTDFYVLDPADSMEDDWLSLLLPVNRTGLFVNPPGVPVSFSPLLRYWESFS